MSEIGKIDIFLAGKPKPKNPKLYLLIFCTRMTSTLKCGRCVEICREMSRGENLGCHASTIVERIVVVLVL